jgi:hypothetical protein
MRYEWQGMDTKQLQIEQVNQLIQAVEERGLPSSVP